MESGHTDKKSPLERNSLFVDCLDERPCQGGAAMSELLNVGRQNAGL
jgi:hypothetical protein